MTIAELLGSGIARLRAIPSCLWRMEARFKGVDCDSSVLFLGRPLLSRCDGSEIVFSEGVRIHSALRANPLGCAQPSVVRTVARGARLVLGKNVGISGAILCAGKSIEIGEGTIIGAGVMIMDNDLHSPSGEWGWVTDYVTGSRPIKIGRGVFIGARAIIMKGVTLGDRSVVGAGAVITKDVPPGMVAVGNPARIIRMECESQSL